MITVRRVAKGKFVQEMPDGTTRPLEGGKSNWAAYDALTEEEITAAALSDPDTVILTDEELRESLIPNPKEIRQKLHMTQEQFAEQFQVPLGTLRDWEQGVSMPDSAAKNYLRVIAKNPQAVLEALAG
jgi:putative transcriptional regulator